jgi:photosystem II stability/assembly factor-like uncharacterized protein
MAVLVGVALPGCVTTGLPLATSSPWQIVPLDTKANPLDVSFTDRDHGFLVGSTRLIMETVCGAAKAPSKSAPKKSAKKKPAGKQKPTAKKKPAGKKKKK